MLIVFFDVRGIVPQEFFSKGTDSEDRILLLSAETLARGHSSQAAIIVVRQQLDPA